MKIAMETFSITPHVGSEGRSLTASKVTRVFSPIKTTLTLIESNDELFCIISSHFMTHYYRFSNLLRKCVADCLGIGFNRVISFSSHNHCTVTLVNEPRVFGRQDRNTFLQKKDLTNEGRLLINKAEKICCHLPERLQKAEVRWGRGSERRISYNRKGHRADGSTFLMREEDRIKFGKDFNGDIDDDVAIVGFYDHDQRALGFLTYFTAHPVTAYNPERPIVFGEYSQIACDVVSDAFDGVPVGFLQGCAGDVNAKGLFSQKSVEESVADSTYYGRCLGQTLVDAASCATNSKSNSVKICSQIVDLPFSGVPSLKLLDDSILDIKEFISCCAANDPDTQNCQGLNFPSNMSPKYRAELVQPLLRWAMWAKDFHSSNRLAEAPTCFPVETVALRIGDIGIVGMCCEPFESIGRQIKQGSPLPLTLPCGYMYDTCIGYVPDSGNNGDREYMSAFYRYTTSLLPYSQPAGDRLAEAGVSMLSTMLEEYT